MDSKTSKSRKYGKKINRNISEIKKKLIPLCSLPVRLIHQSKVYVGRPSSGCTNELESKGKRQKIRDLENIVNSDPSRKEKVD